MRSGGLGRPRRVTLEDFGGPATSVLAEDPEADSAEAAECEVTGIEPEADPDPQAERNGHLSRIAGALETTASDLAMLRARMLGDAAEALGTIAASLLPAMARAGFPALVAEAARGIAACGQWPELAVSLAPCDAEEISGYLAAKGDQVRSMNAGPFSSIRIDPRDDVSAGEAALRWDGGGARIDVAAITDAVLTEYRRKLDLLAQSGG